MTNIAIHPTAEREYEEALASYLRTSPEAATAFEAAFDRTVEAITDNPVVGSAVDEVNRSLSVADYPYSLIYWIGRDTDRIVAVAHAKHLPRIWDNPG